MKAICTYENILEAIRAVEALVGKDLSLPIIQNILIEVAEGNLYFSATNLEIGIVQQVKAKTEGAGKIVVPPQLLTGFLAALRGGEHVTLEKKDDTLFVQSGTYETEIKGFSAEDFPIIPQNSEGAGVMVKLSNLKKVIHKVIGFVTHSEIRPELTGILMYLKEQFLYAVSTDSFRLGEERAHIKNILKDQKEIFFDDRVILPQKICAYINRLPEQEEFISWNVKDNHLFIECAGAHITARLIDGSYPDYTQIIPQNNETTVIVKKDDFVEAMKVMLVFAEKESNEIFFAIAEKGLAVKTKKHERGGSETFIQASVEGPAQEIVVNPRYVLEGIQSIVESEVFIGINNETAPIVFRGASEEGMNDDYTYIVMPVKNVDG